jgi:hypothetical protein
MQSRPWDRDRKLHDSLVNPGIRSRGHGVAKHHPASWMVLAGVLAAPRMELERDSAEVHGIKGKSRMIDEKLTSPAAVTVT